MLKLAPNPVVYRATISGIRISSVDGTALLDNCAALVPYADGLHRVEIYDTAGRQLVGFLKAQGSGETLDVEKVTNGDMEAGSPPTGWSGADDATLSKEVVIVHAGSASCKGVGGASVNRVQQTVALSVGGLYYASAWEYSLTGNTLTPALRFGTLSSANDIWYSTFATTKDAWVQKTGYFTATVATAYCNISGFANGETMYVDDVSVKPVTAPSTNGLTIVSEREGATYNFTSKNASFVYNAANYYCVVRKVR